MEKNTQVVITVDGASCTGKGTLSLLLARELGFDHLDSGLFYRAAGYIALNFLHESSEENYTLLIKELKNLKNEFINNQIRFYYQDKDITPELRSPEVSRWSSLLAQQAPVRVALTHQISILGSNSQGIVADGRDMGTVVFPHALIKFFLTANLSVRASRRFEQIKNDYPELDYDAVYNDLHERDLRDSTRLFSPLMPSREAIMIDTSDASVERSLEIMKNAVKKKLTSFKI